MSTLEKFGILVILILVVIIGVVAVWGVGGEGDNPFANEPAGDGVAVVDPTAPPATPGAPAWPDGTTPPVANGVTPGPVPAPGLGAQPSPANGGTMAPAPAITGYTDYTVMPGDTGASIAKKTGVAWKDISAANKNKDPRKLKIKEVLRIPSGGTAVAKVPTMDPANPNNSFAPIPVKAPVNPADGPTEVNPVPAPAPADTGREVEVRSGDTLYEIARRELGDPNLFYRIQKANPGLDPKKLRPGMKIKVPAK